MKTLPQYVLGYILAVIVVIATVVLLALHVGVPGWFEPLAIFSAGGSTGAIMNGTTKNEAPASPPTGLPPVSA